MRALSRTRPLGARVFATRLRQPVSILLFGVVPMVYLSAAILSLGRKGYMTDFFALRLAGRAVLAGRSPYPDPNAPLLHAHCLLGSAHCFNYPAPAAWLMVPFAALPALAAAALFLCLLAASVSGSLLLLGVRDWRCHGLALASAPVETSLAAGALSPLLLLATALVWRYRDRLLAPTAALAVAVALKLVLWPLAVWLILQRRSRAGLLSLALAAVLLIGAWAALGFAGLRDYPTLANELAADFQARAYTPLALALALGASLALAKALAYLLGASVLVGSRRLRLEELSFSAAVVSVLLLSPIVWQHYFVLLLIPLALAAPHLGAVWLWLVPFSLTPGMANGHLGYLLLAFGLTLGLLLGCARRLGAQPDTSPLAAAGNQLSGAVAVPAPVSRL